jgi:hypothetical protein
VKATLIELEKLRCNYSLPSKEKNKGEMSNVVSELRMKNKKGHFER